jgi:hypothetical protein
MCRSEVHQVLVLTRLRHRVRLRVDGGIKSGRDVVIAAILGAEEYALCTASLRPRGWILVRQCESSPRPVGIGDVEVDLGTLLPLGEQPVQRVGRDALSESPLGPALSAKRLVRGPWRSHRHRWES